MCKQWKESGLDTKYILVRHWSCLIHKTYCPEFTAVICPIYTFILIIYNDNSPTLLSSQKCEYQSNGGISTQICYLILFKLFEVLTVTNTSPALKLIKIKAQYHQQNVLKEQKHSCRMITFTFIYDWIIDVLTCKQLSILWLVEVELIFPIYILLDWYL